MDLVDKYLNESKFTKLKLKRNSPGNYTADIGRIYVSVWQSESKEFWGAQIQIGDYGDDDYEDENFHASTKKELIGYLEKYIKKHSDSIKRKPKKFRV